MKQVNVKFQNLKDAEVYYSEIVNTDYCVKHGLNIIHGNDGFYYVEDGFTPFIRVNESILKKNYK